MGNVGPSPTICKATEQVAFFVFKKEKKMGSRGAKSGATSKSSRGMKRASANIVVDLGMALDLSNGDMQGIVEAMFDDFDTQDRIMDEIREWQEFSGRLSTAQMEWLQRFAQDQNNYGISAEIQKDGLLHVQATNFDAGKVDIHIRRDGEGASITSEKYGTSIF